MAKLESTFKNMVLSLVSISVVAAVALAGVFLLTSANIENQKAQKQQKAIMDVLPQKGEGAVIADPEKVGDVVIYRATKDGKEIGAAVQVSEMGFGGAQKLMVGFDAEGKIVDYAVLEHQETPGLGDKIVFWFKDTKKQGQNILGREAKNLTVSKDGGEVDAITAATISSRAFLRAINKAYAAYMGSADAHSGATKQVKEEKEADHE
ncbi:MAG: RnfABCDGE type electron transport complex subunit G [Paludibacteraceae bacterium]|jgi:electron transport complex protein RnfG|nr:RnfABCDGE type electron transport complex subunit G [Paludibacteraceae bacterium]